MFFEMNPEQLLSGLSDSDKSTGNAIDQFNEECVFIAADIFILVVYVCVIHDFSLQLSDEHCLA